MCGLVGLVLNTSNGAFANEADAFEQILYIDALRGDDATGVALFTNDGEVEILKEATTADYFRTDKLFKEMRQHFISKGKAWIGHNRKATIGKVEDETSHPFVIDDNMVFMHNGTLRNHEKLANTEVDSKALGMHLNACGGDPKLIEKALEDVNGAYACAWIDQEKEMLYLLRNKERPLYLAKVNCGYMYASEPSFIYAVTSRNRMKVEAIEEVPEHALISLTLTSHTITVKKEALVVPKKSMPLPFMGQTKKGTMAGSTDETMMLKGVASKNSYKRFRSKYLGQRIEFWLDGGYSIGQLPPNGVADFVVWGSSDKIEAKHNIQGTIPDIHEDELEYLWNESLITAKITEVYWNPQQGQIDIRVEDLKMVEFSTSGFKDAANESTTSLH